MWCLFCCVETAISRVNAIADNRVELVVIQTGFLFYFRLRGRLPGCQKKNPNINYKLKVKKKMDLKVQIKNPNPRATWVALSARPRFQKQVRIRQAATYQKTAPKLPEIDIFRFPFPRTKKILLRKTYLKHIFTQVTVRQETRCTSGVEVVQRVVVVSAWIPCHCMTGIDSRIQMLLEVPLIFLAFVCLRVKFFIENW